MSYHPDLQHNYKTNEERAVWVARYYSYLNEKGKPINFLVKCPIAEYYPFREQIVSACNSAVDRFRASNLKQKR